MWSRSLEHSLNGFHSNPKNCAAADGIIDFHGSLMLTSDPARDRQAKPGSSNRMRASGIDAIESIEDACLGPFRNARPRVDDLARSVGAESLDGNVHATFHGRELHSVIHEN